MFKIFHIQRELLAFAVGSLRGDEKTGECWENFCQI